MKRAVLLPGILLLLTIYLLPGCKEKERSSKIAGSSGATAEVLVVIEKELWKGQAGEAIRQALGQLVPGMPQAEPMFDPIQMNPDDFVEMYQQHHNIIIVQTDPSLDSATVDTKDDYWASPQRLIRLRAPNAAGVADAVTLRQESIRDLLQHSERRRLQKLFDELQDVTIKNQIQRTMGLNLTVPGGFYVAKLTSGFAWLRKETKDFSQGLIIYYTPYEDTSYFSQKLIINRRDQMCMIYIPGEREGSYMKTAGSMMPESKRMEFNGRFAVETRGLWDVAGDFMGGPFLNYAILDEKNNRILSMDAYIYYPNNDKRDLLLQMEAMMYSLDF